MLHCPGSSYLRYHTGHIWATQGDGRERNVHYVGSFLRQLEFLLQYSRFYIPLALSKPWWRLHRGRILKLQDIQKRQWKGLKEPKWRTSGRISSCSCLSAFCWKCKLGLTISWWSVLSTKMSWDYMKSKMFP